MARPHRGKVREQWPTQRRCAGPDLRQPAIIAGVLAPALELDMARAHRSWRCAASFQRTHPGAGHLDRKGGRYTAQPCAGRNVRTCLATSTSTWCAPVKWRRANVRRADRLGRTYAARTPTARKVVSATIYPAILLAVAVPSLIAGAAGCRDKIPPSHEVVHRHGDAPALPNPTGDGAGPGLSWPGAFRGVLAVLGVLGLAALVSPTR